VVRAACACRIPLISAVGHETDHTLIDLAADRRAPTPTAAAELAVPMRAELLANVAQEAARLSAGLHRMTQERRLRLGQAERGLPDLPNLLGGARQRLDDRAQRLAMALPNLLAARRAALARAERGIPDLPGMVRAAHQAIEARSLRLVLALPNLVRARRAALVQVELRTPNPQSVAAARQAAVALAGSRLGGALRQTATRQQGRAGAIFARLSPAPLHADLRESRARLAGLAARLESVSAQAVLARGYALVLDTEGQAVTSAAQVVPGGRLRLRFGDGEAGVIADGAACISPARAGQGMLPI
jgi:exodeoxyribonuclease VII large subunit